MSKHMRMDMVAINTKFIKYFIDSGRIQNLPFAVME